ncbi:sn-glycerol-1-phosphate dehydrogenase [Salipaludibacillus neizhouensis]|uniref:sn-glycerol-1-phosphate dehydrogenase n=1 Tax=Salipaludibacillus neizhouensis TaxID=885475 RepID=A0A3A9K153_9BACI|nr:sn-glycerol-1-phosphate dehydrogenase [Salipaludibacillus neizhouensis]RKL66834.1 sn-glycerol-1-phosphate dehydrogenase [Salipaludibacillus neizhouensis]
MHGWKESYNHLANTCQCGNTHYPLPVEKIIVENNAIDKVSEFLKVKRFLKAVLVVDQNTNDKAGKKLVNLLTDENIDVTISVVGENGQGDVIADERSIVQVLLDVPQDTDVLIAVGSGTLHDITRFVSFKMMKAFISVPTAPSVDGFNSMGAPIVVNKKKLTFQTHAPLAVFADLNILANAPKEMIAAGFGDILGKYTSLTDWRFSHLVNNEPYCGAADKMTRAALNTCISNFDAITEREDKGIKHLIEALIQSGLAMSLFGHSHPASGAEHHLSHFWEMEYIQQERPQLLHGAKVGVSTSIIADFYKSKVFLELVKSLLEKSKISENELKEIEKLVHEIPSKVEMEQMLEKLGGPGNAAALGISDDLIRRSVKEAHLIRDRCTMLYYYNTKVTEKI